MINTPLLYYCHSFYKKRLNLTEENKKQEPCRQHSTVSLIKYQNQCPKIWIIPKEIKFYQKMILENPGIAQKGTQKSGSTPKRIPRNPEAPKKVPKIMAHPCITTCASYLPPPPPQSNDCDCPIEDNSKYQLRRPQKTNFQCMSLLLWQHHFHVNKKYYKFSRERYSNLIGLHRPKL